MYFKVKLYVFQALIVIKNCCFNYEVVLYRMWYIKTYRFIKHPIQKRTQIPYLKIPTLFLDLILSYFIFRFYFILLYFFTLSLLFYLEFSACL